MAVSGARCPDEPRLLQDQVGRSYRLQVILLMDYRITIATCQLNLYLKDSTLLIVGLSSSETDGYHHHLSPSIACHVVGGGS